MKKSNFLLEGLDSTLSCSVKSKFKLFFQVILIFFNLHVQSLEKLQGTPEHRPSQPINKREKEKGKKKKAKKKKCPPSCSTALSKPFTQHGGEKRRKKNKQNRKSLHKLKIFKEEFELICEAFFFSFLRKNKGDFYFQAAPICQHQKIENYANFSKCLLHLLGSQEY